MAFPIIVALALVMPVVVYIIIKIALGATEDDPIALFVLMPLIGASARNPTELEALKLLFAAPSDAGRSFGAPPAIPADRLAALRRAFDATMKDTGFVALTSQSRLEVDPSTGEQTEGILKKAYATSPEAIAQARKLIE